MTNGERVAAWMQSIGQHVPEQPGMGAYDRDLRVSLLNEEVNEAIDALDAIEFDGIAPAAKELADVLVIAYGGLVSMGLDPDKVFEIVQDENDDKVRHCEDRGDGKRVVPDEIKQELKAETKRRLQALVQE